MSYGNTPHSDQIYTITAHLADLDLYLQALSAPTAFVTISAAIPFSRA